MRLASTVLLALALLVATAWPLSSAIGAASAAAGRTDPRPGGCPVPGAADARAPEPSLGLPPGHPPIAPDLLPPGHPRIRSVDPRLPPGHPPIWSGRPLGPPSRGALTDTPGLLTI
jgi:hypothetical protein